MRSGLWISLVAHFIALGWVVSASQAALPPRPCKDLVDTELRAYRKELPTIWITDGLFIYVEVAKLFNGLIDRDPRLRAAIEAYKNGKSLLSDAELLEALQRKAEEASTYAGSLSRYYSKPFYWHYPVIHLDAPSGFRRIYYTLPVGIGNFELSAELGPDSRAENDRIVDSAIKILGQRLGISLPHQGFNASFQSEKDYLSRPGSPVPPGCLRGLSFSGVPVHASPFDFTRGIVPQLGDRGRIEGTPVHGVLSTAVARPHGQPTAPVSELEAAAGVD